jgi:hypothetical protein
MRNTFEVLGLKQGLEQHGNTIKPRGNTQTQRSSSQRGLRTNHSFHEDNSNQDLEQLRHSNKNSRPMQINGRSDNHNKLGRSKDLNNKKLKDEDELSSLSGFTASDNEENDDIKFKKFSKVKKNRKEPSDDEEDLDQENQDIVLNPKEDMRARFEHYENLRKKNEEERRQREILGTQNVDNLQNIPLKRPHSSHGALKTTETIQPKGFVNRQKENLYPERPQTANVRLYDGDNDEERKPITFKPVYTKGYQQTLIEKKVFNYTDKKFKTIAKKSDPVSRFKAFSTQWNKTKFLKNNPKMKEGRKLNLVERNQISKPEFVFHRYQSKYVFE